jgi:signal peptidase I
MAKWIGKLIPYRQPRHGDVFVFISPAQPGLYVVKRIIGLPGDRIHLQDGVVYRNGERSTSPMSYAAKGEQYDSYRDNFPTISGQRLRERTVTPEWRAELPSFVKDGDLVVPPNSTSPWATIATSAWIAATGASFRAKM